MEYDAIKPCKTKLIYSYSKEVYILLDIINSPLITKRDLSSTHLQVPMTLVLKRRSLRDAGGMTYGDSDEEEDYTN